MNTNGCFFRCFTLIFPVVGLVVIGIGLLELYCGSKSYSWSSCEGIVRQAKVKYGSKGASSPLIRYDYTINGSLYSGEKYRYGGIHSKHSSEKIVAEHPVGSAVKVYYDPNSPVKSVLVPGRGWGSYLIIGFGMVFFLIGSVIWLHEDANDKKFAFRNRRNKE